ncbi:hypothetical protein [Burkholderia pseudomallei]|uniref:hypothetical protein n=1 Tax=Burkholderia pseudomallei TaxID=28450 RepID=UPI0015C2EC24
MSRPHDTAPAISAGAGAPGIHRLWRWDQRHAAAAVAEECRARRVDAESFARDIWLGVHRQLKASPPIRAGMDFIVERVQSAPALQRAGRRRVDRAPGAPVDARRPLGVRRPSPAARRSRFVVRRFMFEALPAVRRASV